MNTPDPHPIVPWLTPRRRAWLYRLVVAALPLLVLYGVLTDAAVPLWIAFAAAFLSSGTAALHTPTETVDVDDRLSGHGGQSAVTVLLIVVLVLVILKLIGAI